MSAPPGIRLLMTADVVGGVWIFAVGLARALGGAGFKVLLVTLGPRPSAAQRAMVAECPGVSLLETDLALEWQDPAGTDLQRARATFRTLARRFAPDLVHLNGFREASFDWQVPRMLVAHSCVNSWASACGETNALANEDWTIYTSNVRTGLQSAQAWVAPTAAFRDQLVKQYELPASGRVIWNGIDNAGHRSGPKLPLILGAGRVWDKAKNLPALASASAGLDWPIRIAGPSAIDGRGTLITNRCELLGEMPHEALLREVSAASIFVSPAFYEPFGLSVLEAASAGCALVLSDIPTFRELWQDAAIFVEPGDTAALTACLRKLCSDALSRTRLQRAAAERARRYALRNTVQAYKALYAALLNASGGHASECAEALA